MEENPQEKSSSAQSPSPVQTPTSTPETPQKRSKLVYVFWGMLVLLILTIGASSTVYIYKSLKPQSTTNLNKVTMTPIPTPNQTLDTSNWKTYISTEEGYIIRYPNTWLFNNGLFSDPTATNSSVQIFIQPKILDGTNKKFSLEEYVKNIAGNETGPSRIPETVTKLTTNSQIIGYLVKWKQDPSGFGGNNIYFSAFFELPNDSSSTLQIHTNLQSLNIATQMISTLKFTN